MMETLRQYVDDGKVEVAKLNNQNQPQKVQFKELQSQVKLQEKHALIYKSLQELDWNQKYQWVNFRRLRANEIYREGNINQAIDQYLISLIGLDLKDKSDGKLQKMQKQLKYPILLNIATCFFKKKQYGKALELCNQVLAQDEQFTSAIYKKAYLLKQTGQYEQSKTLIKKGYALTKKTQSKKKMAEFETLYQQLLKKSQQNKQVYARIFNPQAPQNDQQHQKLLPNNTQKNEQQQILFPQRSIKEALVDCCSSCLGIFSPANLINTRKKRHKRN